MPAICKITELFTLFINNKYRKGKMSDLTWKLKFKMDIFTISIIFTKKFRFDI